MEGKNNNPTLCTVYTNDRGQHMLMMPDGVHFKHVIETVVTSNPRLAECTATFLVNVVPTKEDAEKIYNQTQG